ncbi:MAG: hypothetical protein K0R54_4107 [Clostridiaceae bacterium]|nr:hypothetical protein [Clostridiaceae bacterium]
MNISKISFFLNAATGVLCVVLCVLLAADKIKPKKSTEIILAIFVTITCLETSILLFLSRFK